MMVYLILSLLLLICVYRYDICGYLKNKRKVFTCICVLFILVSGLRYRIGLDSMQYAYIFYHQVSDLQDLTADDFFHSYSEPLFVLFLSFVKTLFGKFYVLQIIQAALVNGLIFVYIWKHGKNVFFCVFVYFLWRYFTYNMEEMRSGLSVAICLFGNDFILKKKPIKGLLLYLIATFFHYSAILLVLTPLLMFLKMNWKFLVIIVVGGFFLGVGIRYYLSDYLQLLSFNDVVMSKMENYSSSSTMFSQQLNIFGLMQLSIQFGLYSILSFRLVKRYGSSLLVYEPFLMIGLMFVVLSIPVPIFYRFINFYTLYFILFYSEHFVHLAKKSKNTGLARMFYPALFYFPFFYYVLLSYTAKEKGSTLSPGMRYYPYSSIIEKSVDPNREKLYNMFDVPIVGLNEY